MSRPVNPGSLNARIKKLLPPGTSQNEVERIASFIRRFNEKFGRYDLDENRLSKLIDAEIITLGRIDKAHRYLTNKLTPSEMESLENELIRYSQRTEKGLELLRRRQTPIPKPAFSPRLIMRSRIALPVMYAMRKARVNLMLH